MFLIPSSFVDKTNFTPAVSLSSETEGTWISLIDDVSLSVSYRIFSRDSRIPRKGLAPGINPAAWITASINSSAAGFSSGILPGFKKATSPKTSLSTMEWYI
ncbi:hypothetical protein HanIR_Chr10g0497711 [Helianthus annuus]|nr:hypothetical protein HanIR_Chr10g0497711 [Helianthus annuus]